MPAVTHESELRDWDSTLCVGNAVAHHSARRAQAASLRRHRGRRPSALPRPQALKSASVAKSRTSRAPSCQAAASGRRSAPALAGVLKRRRTDHACSGLHVGAVCNLLRCLCVHAAQDSSPA